MKLLYVVDPMCSWCWGFSPVMQQLMNDYSTDIELELIMGGLRSDEAPLDSTTREYVLGHWSQVHQRTAQPFKLDGALPKGFVYNSTLPSIVLLVTQNIYGANIAYQLMTSMQYRFYAEGEDITELDVLVPLLAESQLDAGRILSELQRAEAVDALHAGYTEARELGVLGFPSLYAHYGRNQTRRLMTGYQAYPEIKDELDIALKLV